MSPLHGAARAATRPQAMGRDRRPAVWLHGHGMARGSVAAIVGQRGALANPARDCERTRGPCRGDHPGPRITRGFDVTPIHAGDICPLPGLYLGSDSRQTRRGRTRLPAPARGSSHPRARCRRPLEAALRARLRARRRHQLRSWRGPAARRPLSAGAGRARGLSAVTARAGPPLLAAVRCAIR